MFFETNHERIQTFSRISRAIGARADYVQGGGGNTSVKLENGLMAIDCQMSPIEVATLFWIIRQ